jgi:hypothetical protein
MSRRRLLLTAAMAVTASACVQIDGTEIGEPCNPQGICVPGLLCEEGRCRDPADLSWRRMDRPIESTLYGVWGAEPNNVLAVGSGGKILRYLGQEPWADTRQEEVTGFKSTLYAIWGSSPTSIWAAGAGAILFFDGSSWTKQQIFDSDGKELTGPSIKDLHGAGQRIYAVGTGPSYGNLVLRYDAPRRRWNEVGEASLDFTPQGLWVTAGGQVSVVGSALYVRHFDGSTWHDRTLGTSQSIQLRAIWGPGTGTGAGELFAVGPAGALARYDGKGWSVDAAGRHAFKANDIWGRSAADLFVVGEKGGYSVSASAIERCAVSCAPNPMPDDVKANKLNGVWVSQDGGVAYAVGEYGTILVRDLR